MHSTSGRRLTVSAFLSLLFALSIPTPAAAQGPVQAADPQSNAAFDGLRRSTGGRIAAHVAKETRNFDFVLATGGALLLVDDASASPEERALSFLSGERDLLGIRIARRPEGIAALSSSEPFTVDVVDNGEPGSSDSFRIRLSNGYDAGGTLGGGNVQVK